MDYFYKSTPYKFHIQKYDWAVIIFNHVLNATSRA